MSERELIDRAMSGVRVVTCPRCRGAGVVGKPSLRVACPVCRGCGVSTEAITDEREVES